MDNLDKIRSDVFAKHHTLANIYKEFGHKSLLEYSGSWPVFEPSKNLETFLLYTKELLLEDNPTETVHKMIHQLGKNPLVSTIDHFGILNHPFFLNSNLIYSFRPGLKYLVCLATSGISLNNSSWPGCILSTSQEGRMQRFSFFPDKIKTHTVFAVPAFGKDGVYRVEKGIKNSNYFEQHSKQELADLMEEIFCNPEIFNFDDFLGQAGFASGKLWSKIFPEAPAVVYISLEKLIGNVIQGEICPRPEHILHKLFFTKSGLSLMDKYF